MKKNKLTITCFHDYRALPFPEKLLQATALEISTREKKIPAPLVNVIFCSDYKIHRLNKKFRKKDKPTDVLSFPFNDEDFLGEVYLSLQRAAVQARRFNTTYDNEIKRLFVHGILHLLGYDHIKSADRAKMERQEQLYLD